MTSTTVQVMVPQARVEPRGARLLGKLIDAVRAARAYQGAANEQRRRAKEAEALRRHARSFQGTDPGFAADLFAAADRHVSAN